MYFDTHCHLNFKAFDGRVGEVVEAAEKVNVKEIVVPGTDLESSKKAVEIAENNKGVYAAVGIHPHHIFEKLVKARQSNFYHTRISPSPKGGAPLESEKITFASLSDLLKNQKVVAVGEVGIDKHQYQKTKHEGYEISEEFVNLQKEFLTEQIKLAGKFKKALIIHNREAKKEVLEVLTSQKLLIPGFSSVFHCCEPDRELIEYALEHKMFIGVDGDVVYWKEKQEFIKEVPLEILVLETDAPFLSPYRKFPNEPKNIPFIAETVAKLKNLSIKEVEERTTENALKLFNLT